MLKKSTVAVLTAMATAMSVFSPLTVNAISIQTDIDSDVNTIPLNYERVYVGEAEEPMYTESTTSGDFHWVYTEPEESTIPRRDFTVTTAAPVEDTKGIFPIKKSSDITVKVVDSETGEPIKGVQVKFFETETPTSNQIKRDLGSWYSNDSESFTLHDVDYTLENNSSMFVLTAVLEHIPDGYSYNGRMYRGSVIDHIVDTGEWYARGEEVYHDTRTLTIKLDKTYKCTFNAECSVINSVTGELIEDAYVSLNRWDSNGHRQPVDMWYTGENTPHITSNLSYTAPNKYTSELWEFVVNRLPDEYNNSSHELSCAVEINANTPETVEFKIYVDPDGNQVDNTNTRPPQYTHTNTTPPVSLPVITTTTTATVIYDTGTLPPWMNNTTQTTVTETRICDGCGREIKVSDGITTPLGMFLCGDCRASGMGGTRPIIPDKTDTTTQTTVSGNTSVAHPPVTSATTATDDGLYHGRFQAMCFAIDATTGKKVSGAELQLSDENGHIIESWNSSEKCGHDIDIDYTMDSKDSYKNYQLSMTKLPAGYKYSGIVDQTAEGLLSDYHKIDCGFKGIATFAVYVFPEDYVLNDTDVKPWQTTRKTEPEQTQTTANNNTPVTVTATTLAIGNIKLNSEPKKTNYTIGEKLDLTGLDVSLNCEYGPNGKDGNNVIFNHVNPVDCPEAFIVNTHEFDSTKAGTYTIKVKCTDDYKSDYKVMNNIAEFKVTVSENSTLNGDANCDGKLNISDAILIMQSISNPHEYKISESGVSNADVYNRGDGLTLMDALVIQQVQVHMVSESDLPIYR
ncbi:MAG: dockerin type I repeat-containing protein [Ruminococcus sp.]|nr:dockerin type I repeat-containing protein [Ruminococcus sp.]